MYRKNLAILAIISLCLIATISIGILPLSNSQRTITDIKQANVRAYISISIPSSSTTWRAGTTNTIKWTSSGCSSYVTIMLYKDGRYDSLIASSTSNDGEYSWSIPTNTPPDDRYGIKISDYYSSSIYDYSSYFSITAPIPGFTWIYVILGAVMGIAVIGVLLRQRQNFPRVF